jgi:hypothetical protein
MSCFRGGDTADYAGWTLTVVMAGLIMEPVAGETRPRNGIKALSTKKKTVESMAEVDDSGLWE